MRMVEKTLVVVAWHNEEQRRKFEGEWNINPEDERVVFQQDKDREGCAATKNRGIEEAMRRGADVVVVVDDDCFPDRNEVWSLQGLIDKHLACLNAETWNLFVTVTDPPSRGTPYFNNSVKTKRVAASVGFWTEVGDYDACAQLVRGATTPMKFHREIVRGQYFPMSGMNIAFRPKQWLPWCQFQPHERMDDIFMGYIFQRRAYELGYCFNLGGPLVRHSRQSNVWANLRAESKYMEANETVWQKIAEHPNSNYDELVALLPPV